MDELNAKRPQVSRITNRNDDKSYLDNRHTSGGLGQGSRADKVHGPRRVSLESNISVNPVRLQRIRLRAMGQLTGAWHKKSSSQTSGVDVLDNEMEKEYRSTNYADEPIANGMLKTMAAVTIGRTKGHQESSNGYDEVSLIRVSDSRGLLGVVEGEKLQRINEKVVQMHRKRPQLEAVNGEGIWRKVVGVDSDEDGGQQLVEEVQRKADDLLSKAHMWTQRAKGITRESESSELTSVLNYEIKRGNDGGNTFMKITDNQKLDPKLKIGIQRLKLEDDRMVEQHDQVKQLGDKMYVGLREVGGECTGTAPNCSNEILRQNRSGGGASTRKGLMRRDEFDHLEPGDRPQEYLHFSEERIKTQGVLEEGDHGIMGGYEEGRSGDGKMALDGLGSSNSVNELLHFNLRSTDPRNYQMHEKLKEEITLCKMRVDESLVKERIQIGMSILKEVEPWDEEHN